MWCFSHRKFVFWHSIVSRFFNNHHLVFTNSFHLGRTRTFLRLIGKHKRLSICSKSLLVVLTLFIIGYRYACLYRLVSRTVILLCNRCLLLLLQSALSILQRLFTFKLFAAWVLPPLLHVFFKHRKASFAQYFVFSLLLTINFTTLDFTFGQNFVK